MDFYLARIEESCSLDGWLNYKVEESFILDLTNDDFFSRNKISDKNNRKLPFSQTFN